MERQWRKLWHWQRAEDLYIRVRKIYGGLANTWDYGNLGVELKNNVKESMVEKIYSGKSI